MITSRSLPLVALAGNPNTGKTTLFNRLTGSRAKVGNYPGVTVERHMGALTLPSGSEIEVHDVPGTYSLSARSEEEQLAIRAIAGLHPLEQPDCVIAVVDATQLIRNLYLVHQILELGLPVVVALNMTDALDATGQRVDAEALSRSLGVEVVRMSASQGHGQEELLAAIDRTLQRTEHPRDGLWTPTDPALLEDVELVGAQVPESWHGGDASRRRAFALWALLSVGDDELSSVPTPLRDAVQMRHALAAEAGRELELEIIRGRYDWLEEQAHSFLSEDEHQRVSVTDRIDRVLLHPLVGFALFLVLMAVVFQSLFSWADPAIGTIESGFAWIADSARETLPSGWFSELLVDGGVTGVGSVVVFLPQILLLFLFVGLMEDTGYMARVAYLMDRVMRMLGLHGRAFVPMLSGYACAIPAILATRTMERYRDRLLTMMVIPLMTCSARLPVYGLLIAALYPPDSDAPFAQGLLMVGMYLFSTVIALIAAGVLGKTLLRGPSVPLLLEMPPYRMPHFPTVLRLMWEKGFVFLREAGTVILVCTIVLWALLRFPRDAGVHEEFEVRRAQAEAQWESSGDSELELVEQLAQIEDQENGAQLAQSLAGRMGRGCEPVLAPLGFDWKIGVALLGSFAAREVFISTLAIVYGLDADHDDASETLRERVRGQKREDGSVLFTPLVCFSLMVFFALACQCLSTVAVVKRETGGYSWPTFLVAYMTVLAWVSSFIVYQGGRLLGYE